MPKCMLIDASHPEETRVVVLSGNRLEEFDYESTARSQLKGNIYLAKITRVEPSLQAAFVEYGGNRHGFLPFSEIHPDYYRIPIADREALIAEEARLSRETISEEPDDGDRSSGAEDTEVEADDAEPDNGEDPQQLAVDEGTEGVPGEAVEEVEVETSIDTVGGDEVEEDARKRARYMRRYKIQEVIKRRQVMLVQVSKEERGNKGAALTTYLSLAGRYCVLMPNTGRGGGISRKIGSASDRRRLKKVISELDIPDGMAVIVRTAGSERSKIEIRRDYEYLMRLWNEIRESTLRSSAPALIHEEANLIKRAIRDLYSRDMDEIQVDGEEGCKTAKAFMKNLMPSHAKKIILNKESDVPLFIRHKVEGQLDAMHSSSVQLKSGGYIVINPTEALVAIDVNSGKATRERHIEETALKTNVEAADEVARQLRLRDLAGLIVIDFIDMEESRHNREVERRFKEAMRHDRARIQLGRISPFGLLEMSRQRLRPSLFESSTTPCHRCGGSGFVRSTDSTALHVLRVLEEEGLRRGGGKLTINLPTTVALYLLNQQRARLIQIEQRYELQILITQDDSLVAPEYKLERMTSTGAVISVPTDLEVSSETAEEDGDSRRKRGRRRRRRKDEAAPVAEVAAASEDSDAEPVAATEEPAIRTADGEEDDEEGRKPRRRRGKRGGRRRSKRRREGAQEEAVAESAPNAAEDSAESQEPSAEPQEPSSDDLANAEAALLGAAEPDVADQPQEEPAAKPKRRTRKRPARASTAEDAAPVIEAETADATTTADEEPAVAEKPKRRRTRSATTGTRTRPASRGRSRKKTATDGADNADGEASAEPAPDAMDRAQVSAIEPSAQEMPHTTTPPNAYAEASDTSAPERTAPPPASEEADRPKRRGWWQRWV